MIVNLLDAPLSWVDLRWKMRVQRNLGVPRNLVDSQLHEPLAITHSCLDLDESHVPLSVRSAYGELVTLARLPGDEDWRRGYTDHHQSLTCGRADDVGIDRWHRLQIALQDISDPMNVPIRV